MILMAYIIQLLIFLIEFGKRDPKRVRLPCCLHWIHGLHCLSVGVNDLRKIGYRNPFFLLLITIPDRNGSRKLSVSPVWDCPRTTSPFCATHEHYGGSVAEAHCSIKEAVGLSAPQNGPI